MALFSALQKFITKDGQPVEGASVLVYLAGSTTPATLYATRDGGAKSNPFLTVANGNALCYVAPGRYDMLVTKDADQVTFSDMEVGPVSMVGTFAEGGVITDPDQLVEDAAGNKWRWDGALNYVFVPGEDPELVVGWVKWVDGSLRSDLAAVDSAVSIAGVTAETIAELVQQLNARTKNGLVYGDDGRRYRVISAVIRNTGAGWFIIDDATHQPTGLQSVDVFTDGSIRLFHNVGAVETGALIASPDETFAKQGLIIGGSIGPDVSLLQVTAPLEFLVNSSTGAITAPPVFGSSITGEVSAGQVVVTHPTVAPNTVAVANQVGSAAKTDFGVSYGLTTTTLDGIGDVDGYIRFDGANWVYLGSLRTTPTFSFTGGELTVTHASADQFNISLVGREDGLRVGAGAIDKTSFKVRFYDAAGAQVTTPSTLMKFYVTRRAKALKNVLEGNIAVKRGYAPVNGNDVVSASGNIWILGAMVV